MRCSSCGAPVTDNSRFCSHCGAKIDDGVKRTEVTINKHIEDVAEIKRAGYEEKESELRQKKLERELKAKSFRRKILLGLVILTVLLGAFPYIFNAYGTSFSMAVCLPATIAAPFLFVYTIYLMITGKW